MKYVAYSFAIAALVLANSGEVVVAGQCPDTASHRTPDIVDTAVSTGQFKTLAAALGAADLVKTLKGKGPFTVFAPTDEAFAKLPKGTVEELLKPENRKKLTEILTYHVVSGRVLASDVVKLDSAKTIQGDKVRIVTDEHGVKVNEARVLKTDVLASNGVIHVIDQVLLPPEKMSAKQACREVIKHAIHRGVPLYNGGHHASCAAVYEVASMSLISLAADEMPEEIRERLSQAIEKAEQTHDAGRRAWVLRHGLDTVYSAMSNDLQ